MGCDALRGGADRGGVERAGLQWRVTVEFESPDSRMRRAMPLIPLAETSLYSVSLGESFKGSLFVLFEPDAGQIVMALPHQSNGLRPRRGTASSPGSPTAMDLSGTEATQWVGWAAVAALFFTMAGQAWKQWRDRVKHGVSKIFFLGQIAASALFLTYSALVGDRIFVVGNALVLTAAIAGGAILLYNRAKR